MDNLSLSGLSITSDTTTSSTSFSNDVIAIDIDDSVPRKRTRNKGFDWTIDRCIQLLETRKSMEDIFDKTYQTSDAWLKLIRKCGWKIEWQSVRSKYFNLRSNGVPKKFTRSKTGQSGDLQFGKKITELSTLISYHIENSHRYNPPKVIDTSEPIASNSNQKSSETQEQEENEATFDTLEQEDNEAANQNHATNQSDILNDPQNLSWEADEYHELPEIPEFSKEDENQLPFSQTSTTSTFSSTTTSSRSTRTKEPSLISIRKRKRAPTYREILLDSQENLTKIGNDINRFTQSTIDFHSFLMNHLRSSSNSSSFVD